ncbi:MAG: serine hydrolase domain-containing protein [Syntrophobacteraceae bacterium]
MIAALGPLFETALSVGTFSGASLLVASPERVLFEHCWGLTRSGGVPVTADTRFDLASLTKPLATASLCMWAVSQGILKLDAPLSRFFPMAILPLEKQGITLRHLLNHCSGLPPYEPFYLRLLETPPARRSQVLLSRILETPLTAPPGKICQYSDLGFILLGMILETVLEAPLDRLAGRLLFDPLGIDDLHFLRLDVPSADPTVPPGRASAGSFTFAATELCPWRNRLLDGEVHDENAYCLSGVAGHAGLFGTARGVFTLAAFLWKVYRCRLCGSPFSSRVVEIFWKKPGMVPGSTWALGFDTPNCRDSSSGVHFSSGSVGHLGFTGTSLWMDLERNVMIVLLTNRVHPTRSNEKLKAFRPRLHNLVMETYHDRK